jgi:hypothetical protein
LYYPGTSFNFFENSLAQSDFGFINYIVINNVNIDIIPVFAQTHLPRTIKTGFGQVKIVKEFV